MIGVDSEGRDLIVGVGVEIDQSGGHQLSAGIIHLRGQIDVEVVRHGRDLAIGDRHVELPVNVVGGVNDSAALYDPIVLTHRRLPQCEKPGLPRRTRRGLSAATKVFSSSVFTSVRGLRPLLSAGSVQEVPSVGWSLVSPEGASRQ